MTPPNLPAAVPPARSTTPTRPKVKTAKEYEALEAEAARYEVRDAIRPGLRMIVYPKASPDSPMKRAWIFRFHDKKLRKRFGKVLGTFPDMSLSEARRQADTLAGANASGSNPVIAAKKERERQEAAAADVFEKCWTIYDEEHLKVSLWPSSYAVAKRIYDQILLPKFEGQRIGEIPQFEIRELLKDVQKKRGPNAANRVYSILRHFFKFFEGREDKQKRKILVVSPMHAIKKPMTEKARDRDLTDDEIHWLWQACEEQGMFGKLLQFLLLTATRRDEGRCMIDRELNGREKIWTLPGDRTKNGLEFIVPLSDFAAEVLKGVARVKGDLGLVFTQDGQAAISALSKRKKLVEEAMLKLACAEAEKRGEDPAKVEIPNWRIHDLRRTARTRLSKLRVSEKVAERCLNHVEQSGVNATYNRHDYFDEKKEAFALLADHIRTIVTGTAPNVARLDQYRGAA